MTTSHDGLVGIFADDGGRCGVKNDIATGITQEAEQEESIFVEVRGTWVICASAAREGRHILALWVDQMTWSLAMATGVPGNAGAILQKQSEFRRLVGETLLMELLSPTTVVSVVVFAWC